MSQNDRNGHLMLKVEDDGRMSWESEDLLKEGLLFGTTRTKRTSMRHAHPYLTVMECGSITRTQWLLTT